MSKKFIIETADGKNRFKQTYENNMDDSKKGKAKISESDKNYTSISWWPDWERFGMTGLDDTSLKMVLKRVVDIAAYCPAVRVSWNGKTIPIKSLKDWMRMHLTEEADLFHEVLNDRWEVGIAKSTGDFFEQVSIVNGISTYRGGTHVNKISMDISKSLFELIVKGHKNIKMNWADVKSKLFVFLICKIPNPQFDTQTKECLITEMKKDIHKEAAISEAALKRIMKSEIVESILDWVAAKAAQELAKVNRGLDKIKVLKLIDAKGKERDKCVLGIFEGLSALSAVRKFRDPNTMGAFPLKGKFINVSEMTASKIIENEEAINLMGSIGLRLGQKVVESELRYGKIYIYTDQDVDGNSISGLLINFFFKFWPELFAQGRIYKVNTPLLVASKKGSDTVYFYNDDEYKTWSVSQNLKSWDIEYKKGLASLEDYEYEQILEEPHIMQITLDDVSKQSLNCWFGKDSGLRKERLLKP
jgi:DNA topoisomerase-2